MQVAANIAWGANSLQLCKASTMAHIDKALDHLLAHSECCPQAVSSIAYAMARARMTGSKGLSKLVDWAVPRLDSFRDQEVVNLVWACATLNERHMPLLAAAWCRAASFSERLHTQVLGAKHKGSSEGALS
jgi:hypothetical protein